MANIDVISLIFESFELIKAHYKEVALPLLALMLMSGAGGFGGSSFSDVFGSKNSSASGAYRGSPLANAMSDPGALSAGLAGVLLAVVAIVVVLVFVFSVLSMAIWFYISEHFQAILAKKKLVKAWQPRMSAHLSRAFVMALFDFALLAVFIIAIVAIALSYKSIGLLSAIVLFALLVLVFICLGIFLAPAWIYYAIDRLPFFASLGRSFSLVQRNFAHFLVFVLIFFLLGIGSVFASVFACCFAFILMPVFTVFFALLSRVTLLKMKLAMEPSGKAGKKK